MYLYFFIEDAEVKQKLTPPDSDNMESIAGGYLIVTRFNKDLNKFESIQDNGDWEEVPLLTE